jgi:hypothetical protein
MDLVHDSNFVVYVRTDPGHGEHPGRVERPLAAFPTYEEARRVQQTCRQAARDCVIRYEGISGGGD